MTNNKTLIEKEIKIFSIRLDKDYTKYEPKGKICRGEEDPKLVEFAKNLIEGNYYRSWVLGDVYLTAQINKTFINN